MMLQFPLVPFLGATQLLALLGPLLGMLPF
jgi:hypothetical protein